MRIIGTDLVVGSQYTIIADMDIGFFGTSYINGIGASYAITNFNVAIMANTKCAENTGFFSNAEGSVIAFKFNKSIF